MGYTIRVGNAKVVDNRDDFPCLYAQWEVEEATHPEAPVLPNDDVTGNSNERSPSYTVWRDFCTSTGIVSVFYDEMGQVLGGHPGAHGITEGSMALVTAALERYRATAVLPPGFEKEWHYSGPPNYDYHLARLIWLEWWMRWALANCETPAIGNW